MAGSPQRGILLALLLCLAGAPAAAFSLFGIHLWGEREEEERVEVIDPLDYTVDFRVIRYDESYHDVDSSEMAFKIAGSLAFKKAIKEAKPILLEPVMNVEVVAPEEFAGDLMGDLNSRRGRVQGMEVRGHTTIIKAQVPLAEMLSYASDLTSKTGARGSYTMEFSHYDEVPGHLADKVIANAKAGAAGEEEEED